MVSNMADPSWKTIRAVTTELLASNSDRSWGDFKSSVAQKLKVPVESLKPWKAKMKKLIADGVQKASDSNDEEHGDNESEEEMASEGEEGENSAADDSGESDSDEGSRSSKPPPKSGKGGEGESGAMQAFKRMSRAMNLG